MKYFLSRAVLLASVVFLLTIAPVRAQLDPGFGTGGKTTTIIPGSDKPIATFILPDGNILVVDAVYGGQPQLDSYYFIRYNSNGMPDGTYGTNGIVQLPISFISQTVNDRGIEKAIRQTDGKIVLVGRDNDDGLVLRFNENGTFDNSFSGDGVHRPNLDQTGADGFKTVFQQPDGKLVAAGTLRFNDKLTLIRYETNGNLDPNFGDQGGFIINTVTYGNVKEIAPVPGGKFLVFSPTYSDFNPSGAVYRFNSDGTIDNGFSVPSFPNDGTVSYGIDNFLLLNNQKFLVGGLESKTDHLFRHHTDVAIRRYNSDGTQDTSFGISGKTSIDVTSAFDDGLFGLAEQTDGKIVVGMRTGVDANRSYTKNGQLSLARLTSNGTLEAKYLVAEAESFYGLALIQPDGKILTVSTAYDAAFDRDIFVTRNIGVPLETYRFHGVPLQFSFSTDSGFASPTVYRPGNRNWYSYPNIPNGLFFGLTGDVPVPSDYFGDFNSELAMFRPGNGTWYLARSYDNPGQNYVSIQWGLAGDIPVPFDYDGDGKSDLAVFRPSDGNWYIYNLSDGSYRILHWGQNGDKPVAGDYDGDGLADIAVWRPGNGVWYILRSSDGQISFVNFGLNNDVPVHEDFDGDGKFDIAVWRPSTGVWYVLRSSDGGVSYFQWGLATDIAAPGDYDGDHKTDFAIWRPGNRSWYVFKSIDNSYNQLPFGLSSDIPVSGRY